METRDGERLFTDTSQDQHLAEDLKIRFDNVSKLTHQERTKTADVARRHLDFGFHHF